MELTLVYHQAHRSLNTRIFTAFIKFAGIFQFTRLPFGPKRAPSCFQEMMSSIVLAGLMYIICEVYLMSSYSLTTHYEISTKKNMLESIEMQIQFIQN
jgi:hypothetical protein